VSPPLPIDPGEMVCIELVPLDSLSAEMQRSVRDYAAEFSERPVNVALGYFGIDPDNGMHILRGVQVP